MLSSVLGSPRAVQVNVEIMRAFVRMRGLLLDLAALAARVEELENRCEGRFGEVFEALRELLRAGESPVERIGFRKDPP